MPEILLSARKLANEQGCLEGFNRAIEIIRDEVAFPASFFLVCLHPERAEVDRTTIAESLKRLTTDIEGRPIPRKVKAHKESVAIVGSGPAGLTAAHELWKKGCAVTVFESFSQPGGMLKQCIPEFRLPKNLVDAEIGRLRELGIKIETNAKIGVDTSIDDLKQRGFGAILVCVGAHMPRTLGVEGERLKGVLDALDLLRSVNMGRKLGIGRRVAVVGGGNVAVDSSRTALHLGAEKVRILYRRSREEMPANPYDLKEAEDEGVEIQFLVAPRRIIGENNRVTGLECIKMELGEPDETGRRAPKPVEGSEFTVSVDTVILAIGEAPDLSLMPKEVQISERTTVAVDPFTFETGQEGIFAGGDCVTGPASVIEAVIAGRKAAESIDRYLKDGAISKPRSDAELGM